MMENENQEKQDSLIKQVIYGLIVLAALGFSFFFPYHFLQNGMFARTENSSQTGSSNQIEMKTGTWCTKKSNSLDGVPVFGQAGDKNQISVIPEGKYVQLKQAVMVDDKEWAQIDYCGMEAWLPLKRLSFITEEARYIQEGSTIYVNAISEFGIKTYEEPSAGSAVVAENLLYGTEFTVKQLSDGWAEVEYQDQTSWINMYHMGSYGTTCWKVNTLSEAAQINFRDQPSQEGKSLCKIPEDTRLHLEEFDHGWGRTEYDGMTGWVHLHYMVPVEDE